MDNSDILINVINECVEKALQKSNIPNKTMATVTSVKNDNTKATVKIGGFDTSFELINKSGEALAEGDNVFVESIGGNLTNGFISERFGIGNAPIGSIYITSTYSNPSEYLGGTWELIDKEFSNYSGILTEGRHYTLNNTNCSDANIAIQRSGHNVWFRINIVNKVAIGDSTLEMLTFNFENLGFATLVYSMTNIVGGSDGGQGLVLAGLNYSTGDFSTIDVNMKSGTSMAANASIYFYVNQNITDIDLMEDSFCNKFYWKRIA